MYNLGYLPNFTTNLSPAAEIVYFTPLNSTIIETIENDKKKYYQVQFMGFKTEVSMLDVLHNPNAVQERLSEMGKRMADYVNEGVGKGYLGFGVIGYAYYLPLAQMDTTYKFCIGLNIGSKYSMKELNSMYGVRIFYKEGELPY